MAVSLIKTSFPNGWQGPCGDCACEKYSDCDYCGVCSPDAAYDNQPHGEEQARIDHLESRADYYYEAEAAYYDNDPDFW